MLSTSHKIISSINNKINNRMVLGSVRRTETNESENYYVQFAKLQKR